MCDRQEKQRSGSFMAPEGTGREEMKNASESSSLNNAGITSETIHFEKTKLIHFIVPSL